MADSQPASWSCEAAAVSACAAAPPRHQQTSASTACCWTQFRPMPAAGLLRVPATADGAAETVVAALRDDGACIVEGLFDVATIATMRRAVRDKAQRDADSDARPGSASQGYIPGSEALTESAPDWIAEFVGVNTVRFSSLGKISGDETRDAYFRMLDNALYKSVADAMLLPFAGTYWVNTCVIQSFCCLLSAALLSALRSARLCSASLDLALQRSAHT